MQHQQALDAPRRRMALPMPFIRDYTAEGIVLLDCALGEMQRAVPGSSTAERVAETRRELALLYLDLFGGTLS